MENRPAGAEASAMARRSAGASTHLSSHLSKLGCLHDRLGSSSSISIGLDEPPSCVPPQRVSAQKVCSPGGYAAARGPRGFCCETGAQLREAWTRLTDAHSGIRLVLKPAGGSGGSGVLLDVSRDDVEALADQMTAAAQVAEAAGATAYAEGEKTILEEMVGVPGQPSPTVYMVGRTVAIVADQLLTPCGTINLGNVSPAAEVDAPLMEAMGTACAELGAYLGLVGQWVRQRPKWLFFAPHPPSLHCLGLTPHPHPRPGGRLRPRRSRHTDYGRPQHGTAQRQPLVLLLARAPD